VAGLREVAAWAVHLPEDSATFRAVYPDRGPWGLSEQLLAEAVDTLHWLQWAKTVDGSKNRNHPRPIPRPGVEPEREKKTYGTQPVPLDELRAFLGWNAA